MSDTRIRAPGERRPKRRMLIIVNPYATTVSDRLKNLVVYALQGRFEVEAVSTEAQNHATEIGREAIDGGYDIVVAFGGDGTLNEVVNGLAGTDIPISVLPGGSTNVVARSLGIPNDVVDATEHLLSCADDFQPRPIDLGIANGRRFVFACGAGLDATAAHQVDSHPKMKHRFGPYYYTWAAVKGFYGSYLRNPVQMKVTSDEGDTEGVTAICQNTDPFTYFRGREIRISAEHRDRRRQALARRPPQGDAARRPLHRPSRPRQALERRRPSADRRLRRDHRGADRIRLQERGRHLAPVPGPARRRPDRHARRARARRSTPARSASSPSRGGLRRHSADCLFCSIVAGELEATIVFEDDDTIAFLDNRPLFPGHDAARSRASITRRSRTSLPPSSSPVFANARTLAGAIRRAMGAEGTFVALNNTVSQSVPHLHVHVVPRVRKDGLRGFFWPRNPYEDQAAMEAAGARIRAEL